MAPDSNLLLVREQGGGRRGRVIGLRLSSRPAARAQLTAPCLCESHQHLGFPGPGQRHGCWRTPGVWWLHAFSHGWVTTT